MVNKSKGKITHLYGEMDIDFSKTIDQIYKRAFRIAENCGYMVVREKTKEGEHYLEFFGEDCPDNIIVTTRAHYDPETKKVTRVEKVVMKYDQDYPANKIIKKIPVQI